MTSSDSPLFQIGFEDIYTSESLRRHPFEAVMGNHDFSSVKPRENLHLEMSPKISVAVFVKQLESRALAYYKSKIGSL